jgi:hypothetical protein
MEILSRITSQAAAVGLPLYAVTVTALPRPNTPLLLMLHWHGYRREAGQAGRRPVPGSALQLNTPWLALGEIDAAMLDAAWQLGAWDLERRDRRACSWIGAPAREALECQQAFGENPFSPGDERHLLAEVPDRHDLMRLATVTGYVRWLFRPVRGGLWRDTAEDDTLGPDGGRMPPCPVAPQTDAGRSGLRRETRRVYRLGRVSRLVVVGA